MKIPEIISDNCSLPANNEVFNGKSEVMHLPKFHNKSVPMQLKTFDKLPPLSNRSSMVSGKGQVRSDEMKDSFTYVFHTSKKEVVVKKSLIGSESSKVKFKNKLMFDSSPKKFPEKKCTTTHNIHWNDVLTKQKTHDLIFFRNRNIILTIPRQIALKPEELCLIQHEPLIFEKNKNICKFENANGSILKRGPFVANGVHTCTSYEYLCVDFIDFNCHNYHCTPEIIFKCIEVS